MLINVIISRILNYLSTDEQLIELFNDINTPLQTNNAHVINISNPKLSQQKDKLTTLSLKWFGCGNYEIRLGELSILTDPFVTYYNIDEIKQSYLKLKKIISDKEIVLSAYGSFESKPNAIFLGHSHYDHILDVSELLKLNGCENIPVYGSKTAGHILAGYEQHINKNLVDTSGKWIPCHHEEIISENISKSQDHHIYYKAFDAEHAPHVVIGDKEIDFWDEKLEEDRKTPPEYVSDFPSGQSLIYIFKFISNLASDVEYKVALIGAAAELPNNFQSENVDVVILCVPGSQYIEKYPINFIKKLEPRFIVLSHYDNFFKPRDSDFFDRRDKPVFTLLSSNFYSFLHKVQNYIAETPNYDRFESILVPDVGATMYFKK